MSIKICFTALIVLMISGIAFAASSEDEVALTVYVHEGDLNGTMLSGVEITGEDAEGNSFYGITDSSGAAVVRGHPGTWRFEFEKSGYNPLDLTYDVTQTDEAAAYLERAEKAQTSGMVSMIIYVHEGDLNGTLLSGVQVTGEDAAGNRFDEITNSRGIVSISGEPGSWQFTFEKEGYETLDLSYEVNESEEVAAYIQRANT